MEKIYFLFAFFIGALTTTSFAQPGSPDPEFGGGDGVVLHNFYQDEHAQGYDIAVQKDGNIIVTGGTRIQGGFEQITLCRYQASGEFDHTFNGNGKMIIPVTGFDSYGIAVKVQADEKIVLLANHYNDSIKSVAIYRFNSDGSPDNSFDSDGVRVINLGTDIFSCEALAIQDNGKIVIGGYTYNFGDTITPAYVARFLPNGTPDNSFDDDGYVLTPIGETYVTIEAIVIQPDHKIIAAGYGDFNNNEDFVIARYNEDGSLDQNFSGDGKAKVTFTDEDDDCTGLALQPDGKIVLGGYARMSGSSYDFAAARFLADGTLDNAFHGDGMATVAVTNNGDVARGMALQPDGKILLAGYANSVTSSSDMTLVRLNPNGIPDFTFDDDGVKIFTASISTDDLDAIVLQSDGKIVGTGYARFDGINSLAVVRFLSGLTVSVDPSPITIENISLAPNPVSKHARLSYHLQQSETISITLTDLQGKMIEPLMPFSDRNPGDHTESLNITHDLPPGMYLMVIEAGRWVKSFKVMFQ